ncbi:maleylpyruvate isomerase family mycothiol-dependent enzyme [Nocardioides sp.]|uniref:maleylpyruvate isomerase family mycothiol-dependent enzyme n=1 Tax=Nocardioides sp. TaxID=35761 RepID=UPI002C7AFACE|nr:maleylpyruvate isomerase family mycothiol-dependent enzyme [Nocardioides sp.]HXH80044.1 maleylpyruvate isomerase family mycothiol-dependent enzyme [Nocardioides sp.]
MTDAPEELRAYVDVWWEAVNDFTALLDKVPADAWDTPTDLPGWDVRAVVAHTAHLESLVAGGEHEEVEIGDAPHVRGTMGQFTEQGVVARRDKTRDELVNEIRGSITARHTQLLADPPTDPDAPAPGLYGAIGWDTRTLLRNRPLDVWMHEQDIRRALAMPGGMDTPAARHAIGYLSASLGYVLAKRVKAPPGSSVVAEVEGREPVAAVVSDEGRGVLLGEVPGDPTTGLRTDAESFILLAGGRRRPEPGRVEIFGDVAMGQLLLDHLAVTP